VPSPFTLTFDLDFALALAGLGPPPPAGTLPARAVLSPPSPAVRDAYAHDRRPIEIRVDRDHLRRWRPSPSFVAAEAEWKVKHRVTLVEAAPAAAGPREVRPGRRRRGVSASLARWPRGPGRGHESARPRIKLGGLVEQT
jgi:hypothetical protein